jgi:HEAT repeats
MEATTQVFREVAMPKRRRGLLVVVFLATILVAVSLVAYSPWEARYLGKRTSWWASRIQGSSRTDNFLASLPAWMVPARKDVDDEPDPYDALHDNPAAVPVLVQLLGHSDAEVRTAAAFWFPKDQREIRLTIPVLAAAVRSHPSASGRSNAAESLEILFKKNQDIFGEERTRIVVPALLAALKDENKLVRKDAAHALSAIDPETAQAAGIEVNGSLNKN